MNDNKHAKRVAIGRRITSARESLPDDRRSVGGFAQLLGITESNLSQMESGSRPVSADVLATIAETTGVAPGELLGSGAPERDQQGFEKSIEFLQQADLMGIESLDFNRDLAIRRMVSFIGAMYAGDVCITGSSLKGFQQDSNSEVVQALARLHIERPKVTLRVMFTHPRDGYRREVLEGRVEGSIVTEIWQGIRWAIEMLHVPIDNIKLVKASPSIFSIFAVNGKNGLGLINPYPLMKQAFVSFCILVRSGRGSPSQPALVTKNPIYESLFMANFRGPWDDQTGRITVNLDTGIRECLEERDENLKREAQALKDLLERQRASAITRPSAAPENKSI